MCRCATDVYCSTFNPNRMSPEPEGRLSALFLDLFESKKTGLMLIHLFPYPPAAISLLLSIKLSH